MKRAILFSLFLTGCMVSNGLQYEAESETNLYHLARVRKGMDEKQVLQIMHKPYSYESFEFDGDVYDVWFYVTRPTGLDQTRMVPQNLTPLTFKNGILVGNGYNWYYYAMKGQAEEAAEQIEPPEKKKTQEVEDKEFEKALKSKPTPTTSFRLTDEESNSQPKMLVAVTTKAFSKIRKGMSEQQVRSLLGPAKEQESISTPDDLYHIWFYDVSGQKVPLTFKNGTLIGTTEKEYEQVQDKAGVDRVGDYDQEDERMLEDESDQNFNNW
jgi:outer membrane protein assembly factor BamE (lipoprotein component of BamABCDE complex)